LFYEFLLTAGSQNDQILNYRFDDVWSGNATDRRDLSEADFYLAWMAINLKTDSNP